MLAFLIEQGADMDVEDRYGMTPLMIAMGDPESRYYRNVGVGRYDDRYRRTRGKVQDEMVELLLASGARPFTGEVMIKHSLE
jgi:hypothetical protein